MLFGRPCLWACVSEQTSRRWPRSQEWQQRAKTQKIHIPTPDMFMCVPGSNLLKEVKSSSDRHLHASAALSPIMIGRSEVWLAAAGPDQSNGFNSDRVAVWLPYGQCCPAFRARAVWHHLPESMRRSLGPRSCVFPGYMRFAMGSSHSERTFLSTNIICVGGLLVGHRQFEMPPSCAYECPQQCLAEARHLRRGDERASVVLHQYSGAARENRIGW